MSHRAAGPTPRPGPRSGNRYTHSVGFPFNVPAGAAMTERSVFLAALDIADPAARSAYLDETCAADPALRLRVEELLAAHAGPASFMARPAPDLTQPAETAGFAAP